MDVIITAVGESKSSEGTLNIRVERRKEVLYFF